MRKRRGFTLVELLVVNGGADSIATAKILVTEPMTDAWVQRTPGKDEKPEENQSFARDDKNEGTLFYNGTFDKPAESVFLNVTADGKPQKSESQTLAVERSYAFTVKLKPGLIKYKVEFGVEVGGKKTVIDTVNNIAFVPASPPPN